MKHLLTLLLAGALLAACGTSGDNGEAARKAHADSLEADVRAVYEIMSSGNVDGLDKYIAEDVVDHQMMPGYPPGLEGLKKMMKDWFKGYTDNKMTVDRIIVQGNEVAVLFTWSATNTGEFMGMPATNKSVSVQGVDWMRIENGKSVEHWGFMEEMKMMMQLGLMPEMPAVPESGVEPESADSTAT